MIFHHHAVRPLGEFRGNNIAECLAAGNIVFGKRDLSANRLTAGDQAGIRAFPHQAERDERGRMRMKNGFRVGTQFVNRAVERQFHARTVFADNLTIRFDHHNIIRPQSAFVNAAGRDPDIAVTVLDGNITAGGGGHAIIIKTLEVGYEQVSRMNIVAGHNRFLNCFMFFEKVTTENIPLKSEYATFFCKIPCKEPNRSPVLRRFRIGHNAEIP